VSFVDLEVWCPKVQQLVHWVPGPKVRYFSTLNFLPKRERPEVIALVVASLPAIVRTMVDADSWNAGPLS